MTIGDRLRAYRPYLRFCLQVTVAGLAAFAVTRSLHFPLQGLWAVLTAIVVSQVSVGGSLRATIEYNVGTIGGAVYAALIGLAVPHSTAVMQAVALAIAVAPLAVAAAINPIFRVAPFSAVLVLLIGGELGESPIVSAATRVLEVAIGGAVAVVVSLLVFPQRAETLGREAACRILGQMADLLPELLAALSRDVDRGRLTQSQNELGAAVVAFQNSPRKRVASGSFPGCTTRTRRRCRARSCASATISSSSAAPPTGRFRTRSLAGWICP